MRKTVRNQRPKALRWVTQRIDVLPSARKPIKINTLEETRWMTQRCAVSFTPPMTRRLNGPLKGPLGVRLRQVFDLAFSAAAGSVYYREFHSAARAVSSVEAFADTDVLRLFSQRRVQYQLPVASSSTGELICCTHLFR
jgi:hypothetical protein